MVGAMMTPHMGVSVQRGTYIRYFEYLKQNQSDI